MTSLTDVERNPCFGYVSELTFIVTKDAIEHFDQKYREAPPEHLDVYRYLNARIEHVRATVQTECTVRREAFLREQERANADMDASVKA